MAERSVQLRLLGAALLLSLAAACVPVERGIPERPPTPEIPPPVPPPPPTRPTLPTPPPAPEAPGTVEPAPPAPTAPPVSAAGATLLSESRAHQAAGRYELAAASLERALRIEPRQPLLWLELGELRLREGDYVQAESLGRRALSLSVGDSTIRERAEKLISDARRR